MNRLQSLPREIGEVAKDDPYLPFPAALDQGFIEPAAGAGSPQQPPLQLITGLRLPKSRTHETVNLGQGRVGAFDHVSVQVQTGDNVYVRPTPKTAVERTSGRILLPGLCVLMASDYSARIVSAAVDSREFTPWQKERLGIDPYAYSEGELAVAALWTLDAPEYRIWDYDPESGEVLLAPQRRLFGYR